MKYLFLLFFIIYDTYSSDVFSELFSMAIFPPNSDNTYKKKTDPMGHMKPLGYQRPPESPIKEYTKPLNANQYWEKHVRDHIPLVYRGLIKESPAIAKWSDDYLAEKYGDLDVLVEHKLEDRTSTSGRMRLKDFLKNYKDQDMYIVSMFPTEMMGEVKAIPSVLCGTFKNFTHESNFWMSNGGTRSVIHYDADHNLHCMLSGRKDFIMINNNLTTQTNLYFKRKDPGVGSGFSFLDPDSIDMHKFPKISKVPWTYATLYPGDCIYIPSVYIHQVRGYGRTIAVTTLFTADVKNDFRGDDCSDETLNKYHSMADIKFQWTYKKGDATIDMGYMNLELVRNQLIEGLRDKSFTKNKKLTKKQFVYFAGVFSPYGRNKTKIANIWTDVFKLSDDFLLDKKAIRSLSQDQMKKFCRAIESPHGVVTNGTEPVFVRPGERHQWESEHPDEDDSEYMTKLERRIKEDASRDPMLDYLSDEEAKAYIESKKEKKAKYGQQLDEEDFKRAKTFEIYIPWSLNDIPRKYQTAISEGVIPDEYAEEFISNLPEDVLQKYKSYFDKKRVPIEVVRYLSDVGTDSYKKVVEQRLNDDDSDDDDEGRDDEDDDGGEGDDEDGEPEDWDREKEFPFEFSDLDHERKKMFLNGKIIKSDVKEFLEYVPRSLDQYKDEIREGRINDEVLMVLLKADKSNFNQIKRDQENKIRNAKDEL